MNRIKPILHIFLLAGLSVILTSAEIFADTNRQDSFLAQLSEKAKSVESISSDFVQQSFISLFKDKVESKGHFTFSRPDNLRWEYSAPFASGFLIKGSKGLRWDEAAENPTPFNIDNAPDMAIISEQILAWTTMDIDWLKSRYDITITSYRPAVMELKPKSEKAAELMNLIKIFFSDDASHLKAIELHEPGDDYTRIDFRNVKINSSLPAGIFERK